MRNAKYALYKLIKEVNYGNPYSFVMSYGKLNVSQNQLELMTQHKIGKQKGQIKHIHG